jgi:Uma2 family endonuclease
MAHSATAVSLEQYLNTSYHPDVEYIDGYLKEKPVVGFRHGELQGILCQWFREHRKEWAIKVAVETRTQVTEDRVRLPDVVVVSNTDTSLGTLNNAPLIVIEVLSPTDTYIDLKNRASDLRAMGTENVWLLDPEKRTAEVWNGSAWEPYTGKILQAVNSPMHLDLDWLWTELDD